MALAILAVGTAFITNMYLNGYRLWKRSFDELLMQQAARRTMGHIVQALREGSPGTVQISTPAGMPKFSQISFQDGRGRGWIFRQRYKGRDVVASATVYAAEMVMRTSAGASATTFLAEYVSSLSFVYPSFQDTRLIDVGITMQRTSYRPGAVPTTVQLVERVRMRNP